MRAALDASYALLPPSGTGTYVRHLSTALRRLDPSLDLHMLEPGWPVEEPSNMPSRRRRLAWELWGVQDAARRVSPDLVHIPHFSAPLRASSIPLIVTVHDVIPLVLAPYRASRAMQMRLPIIERTIRRARLVLAPSHHAAADIERVLSLPRDRIRVVPEAADPACKPLLDADDRQRANAHVRGLGINGSYVFNIAGFDIRKNLPVLIEAFARALPSLDEPVSLVIAGAPHSSNESVFPPVGPLIERLGLSGKVLLTGFVSEATKTALYQRASLYVTPSSYEGFGLTALEAMACGTPTIAADCTSLPEVVGTGGLLVRPEAAPLAAAMVAMLNDPHRSALLREAGLARASGFSWRATARMTLDAYQEALHLQ